MLSLNQEVQKVACGMRERTASVVACKARSVEYSVKFGSEQTACAYISDLGYVQERLEFRRMAGMVQFFQIR